MNIVTRREWGFDGWADPNDPPTTINEKTQRTEFFIHYNGPATGVTKGSARIMRDLHAFHKRRGWKGIAYGHVAFQDGTIWEGRGFTLRGSHCPDHNTSGYSAMGYIGEGETPSPAMLAAIRWLYDEARRRSGNALAKKGHRDGIATECPGDRLYAWVRAGMPAASGGPTGSGGSTSQPIPTPKPTPQEEDMPITDEEVAKVAKAAADAVWTRTVGKDTTGQERNAGFAQGATFRDGQRQSVQLAGLETVISKMLDLLSAQAAGFELPSKAEILAQVRASVDARFDTLTFDTEETP